MNSFVRSGSPGWFPTLGSGKEVTLPSPPPLRTARECFHSCSSSLSNAPLGTRLTHVQTLAVNLLVTVRMHEHAVLDRIRAPMSSPLDVVAVPPRHRGDLLMADRTDPALLPPKQAQSPSTHQGPGHL